MDIKIGEVQGAVGGKPLDPLNESFSIRKVSMDTRTLAANDLFFALEGLRFDGHDFIEEAFEKGARNFVVSKANGVPLSRRKSANFLVVEEPLKAYGDLARVFRQKFRIPAIAITGSSGKTTVKELVAHLLSARFRVLKNRGTENNFVGVPKTLFQLEEGHEVLVVELGTNSPGEIERLSSIVQPQVAIITQIGPVHLERLKDVQGVREEKLKVLNHLERGGILILNGLDPLLQNVQSGVHKILWGGIAKDGNGCEAEEIRCHEDGTSFSIGQNRIDTPLIGRHNVQNCLLALLAASALGVDFSSIQKSLAGFKPPPGRLVIRDVGGIRFMDDTYNANPHSFRAALETLKEFKIRERKGVVCGDMLELGERAEAFHRELGVLISQMLFDFVIAAGPFSKHLVEEALKNGFDPSRIHHVPDSVEAGRLCRKIAAPGDWILVKGSRGAQMERVFECFTNSSIL